MSALRCDECHHVDQDLSGTGNVRHVRDIDASILAGMLDAVGDG